MELCNRSFLSYLYMLVHLLHVHLLARSLNREDEDNAYDDFFLFQVSTRVLMVRGIMVLVGEIVLIAKGKLYRTTE